MHSMGYILVRKINFNQMKKYKFLLILISIIFLYSCKDGKFDFRKVDTCYYPFADNSGYQENLQNAKKVFLINTSSNKKLKFTVKINKKITRQESFWSDSARIINDKKVNTTPETIQNQTEYYTLEPGAEISIGINKYKEVYDNDIYYFKKEKEFQGKVQTRLIKYHFRFGPHSDGREIDEFYKTQSQLQNNGIRIFYHETVIIHDLDYEIAGAREDK